MKKKLLTAAALLLGITIALCSCSSDVSEEEFIDEAADTESTIMIDNLYQGENIIMSDTSLNMALALAMNGSGGDTLSQMEKYTGMSKDDINEWYSNLNASYKDLFGAEILIANSMWADSNRVSIKGSYIDTISKALGAECSDIDFSDTKSADKINKWVSENTKENINEIVNSNTLNENSMMLVNTLYFLSPWATPYEEFNVTEDTFNNLDGSTSDVTMLNSTEDAYLENDKATGFMKPYDDGICFVGILPKDTGEFEFADLEIDSLLKSESYDYDVNAAIPEFEIQSDMDLTEPLKKLGVTDMFDSNKADFKGITDDEICVSSVIQKATIKLDKNGTEASAATAMMFKTTALPVERESREVRLDRPFAFMIYDTVNETILFSGKIVKL